MRTTAETWFTAGFTRYVYRYKYNFTELLSKYTLWKFPLYVMGFPSSTTDVVLLCTQHVSPA